MKRTSLLRLTGSITGSIAFLAAIATVGGGGCSSNSPDTGSSFDGGVADTSKHEDVTNVRHDTGSLTGPDTSTGGGDACASTSKTATVAPLDMYILLDRSGSMEENNSWTQEVLALTDFVYDVNSTGIGVGIQYLPLPQLCDPAAYAMPAVPLANLPANQGPIATSLSQTHPYGGTPTVPALEGAVAFGKARQKSNPDRDFVIVLSTDGVPDTSCSFVGDSGLPNSTANAIAVIKAAAEATPPIKTFVIGVGNEPALNAFAAAGGTGQAILVGAGDAGTTVDIETPLIDALTAIRTTALPCQYPIPKPEAGTINPTEVNVTFTPGSGSAQSFYGVGSLADCQTKSDDWYYDDPTNPTSIVLCPNSCTEVKASSNGSVNVVFGCETNPPPIAK